MLESASEHVEYLFNEAWESYRNAFNPSMPEDMFRFWHGFGEREWIKLAPKYANLIDPISLEWIDPEYPLVTTDKKGNYIFKIEEPIHESDCRFLYNKTKMKYVDYRRGSPKQELLINIIPDHLKELARFQPYEFPLGEILHEVEEDIMNNGEIPEFIWNVYRLWSELAYINDLTPEQTIQIKREYRTRMKNYRRKYGS